MEGAKVTIAATFELLDPASFTDCQATLFLYEDDVTWCCGYDFERHWERVVRMVRSTPLDLTVPNAPVVVEEVYEISEALSVPVDVDNLRGVAVFERRGGDKAVIQAAICWPQQEWIPRLSLERRAASAPGGFTTLLIEGTLENLGSSPDVVDLTASDDLGWPLDFRIGADPTFRTAASSVVLPGEALPLVLRIETDGAFEIREARLVAQSRNGGQIREASLRIFNGSPSIFFANDDSHVGSDTPFIEFLDARGYLYDVDDFPDALEIGVLAGYDAVLWQTGTASSLTLSGQEQSVLASYLEAEGGLFLSSMDFTTGLAADNNFISEFLGVESWIPNTRATTAIGMPGDPITDGMVQPLDWALDALNRVDTLVPGASADVIFRSENGAPAAVRNLTNRGNRVVYSTILQSAFPTSDPDPNNGQTFLARVFEWLLPQVPSDLGPTSNEASPRLRAWPNPWFDENAPNLTFRMARSDLERVRIFDSAGRLVRVLGVRPNGEVTWDGRDARGESVPAGAYLAEAMSTDGASSATRVVRLR